MGLWPVANCNPQAATGCNTQQACVDQGLIFGKAFLQRQKRLDDTLSGNWSGDELWWWRLTTTTSACGNPQSPPQQQSANSNKTCVDLGLFFGKAFLHQWKRMGDTIFCYWCGGSSSDCNKAQPVPNSTPRQQHNVKHNKIARITRNQPIYIESKSWKASPREAS